ncbi:MAG: beta-ketoacyl synthase chain length factor [Desulfobacterales bacterium]|nr:beta-ketoacyl synthase chain length factor [Desulfobacterales bacterium]
MNVAGIGVVFTRGRGIDSYEEALRQGWVPPCRVELSSAPDISLPVYYVAQETITDKAVLRRIRRADRFSKMAVLAAWDAVQDSGIVLEEKGSSLGIIVATAFGPHATTFRFLDDILDYGHANVSPTIFSHSVHNAAASYIAYVLGTRGPTLTLSQFAFSFHQAIILAESWLNEGRCDYVLVGGVDECHTVMEYICSQKLAIADDGKIKPFHFSASPSAVPGEGSVFFLATRTNTPKTYCEISGLFLYGDGIEEAPDMYIFDADGMAGDERGYKDAAATSVMIAGYSPVFGSMMTGSAFHCAAGALMLKHQIRYACPVQDNSCGVNLCAVTESAEIKKIWCVRINCVHEKASIRLKLE